MMSGNLVKKVSKGKNKKPKRALLIGMANGGTTATSKCVLQHQDVKLYSSDIKLWSLVTKNTKSLNYPYLRLYYANSDKKVIFDKEALGFTNKMINMPLLPPEKYENKEDVHLLFLYRNPVFVWNSWTKRKWNKDINHLFDAYSKLDSLRKEAEDKQIDYTVICFENFLEKPKSYLENICTKLNIDYKQDMVEWKKEWHYFPGGKFGNPNINNEPLKKVLDTNLIISLKERLNIEYKLSNHFQDILSKY